MKATEIRKQPWFDNQAYPFQSRTFSTPEGEMHYIDEGEGDPILFVHGTPAWSFIYREMIQRHVGKFRCVAADHLGFGLSEKPVGADYRPQAHAKRLAELVNHLGLKRITLVVHDFGGPIGLGFAQAHPELISKIVLLNTWMWETASNPQARKIDKTVRSWLGKFLYLNLNFSPKVLFKQAFYQKTKLTKSLVKHMVKVFPDKTSRHGLWEIGKALVGESKWYGGLWANRNRLKSIPMEIYWGMKDKFITPEYLEKWVEAFPEAKVEHLDCGHFVQEEMEIVLF